MAGGKTDFAENGMLNARYGAGVWSKPAQIHLGLFSVLPTDASAGTELTSATAPNYSRVQRPNDATFWNAPTGGQISNSSNFTFPTPQADWPDIVGLGIWDAATAGNLIDYVPFVGASRVFTATAVDDTFRSAGHPFTNGMRMRLFAIGAMPLPGNAGANTGFFVVNATTNTFQLSNTSGGTAIDVTTDGMGEAAQDLSTPVRAGIPINFGLSSITLGED